MLNTFLFFNSSTQIRRAFRNLASKEHPDKGGDPHRFRNIQEAYEVLSNTQKVSQK
jgi:DnaJ-class molecular chaperone